MYNEKASRTHVIEKQKITWEVVEEEGRRCRKGWSRTLWITPKHGHDQVIVLKDENWQHYPTLKNEQPQIRQSKNFVLMTSQLRIYFASQSEHTLLPRMKQQYHKDSSLEDRNYASLLSLIWDNVHHTLNYFLIKITPLTIYTPIPGERFGSRALTRGIDYTNCKGCLVYKQVRPGL